MGGARAIMAAASDPRVSQTVAPSELASVDRTTEEQFTAAADAAGLVFRPLPAVPRSGHQVDWFGRIVEGASVAALTAAQQQLIVDGLYRYGLIHIPQQHGLVPQDEIRLATLFDYDPPNVDKGHPVRTISRVDEFPCIVVQGLGEITEHWGIDHRDLQPFPTFKHMWHTDGMSQLEYPPVVGCFYCIDAPFGDAERADGRGATRFIDTQRIFEGLSPEQRELALRLRVQYTSKDARVGQDGNEMVPRRRPGMDWDSKWPEHINDVILTEDRDTDTIGEKPAEFTNDIEALDPIHPLVQTHHVTGQPTFIGLPGPMLHMIEVLPEAEAAEGQLEVERIWSPEESRAWLADILRPHVEQDQIFAHGWSSDDVVLWDQRRLMHINPPVEEYAPERRIHHRIRLDASVGNRPQGAVDALLQQRLQQRQQQQATAAAGAAQASKL